jgi:hypothetical protein
MYGGFGYGSAIYGGGPLPPARIRIITLASYDLLAQAQHQSNYDIAVQRTVEAISDIVTQKASQGVYDIDIIEVRHAIMQLLEPMKATMKLS